MAEQIVERWKVIWKDLHLAEVRAAATAALTSHLEVLRVPEASRAPLTDGEGIGVGAGDAPINGPHHAVGLLD